MKPATEPDAVYVTIFFLLRTLNFISDHSVINRMICVEIRTQNQFWVPEFYNT